MVSDNKNHFLKSLHNLCRLFSRLLLKRVNNSCFVELLLGGGVI